MPTEPNPIDLPALRKTAERLNEARSPDAVQAAQDAYDDAFTPAVALALLDRICELEKQLEARNAS